MAEKLEVFVKLVKGLSEAPVSDSVREACRAASEALEEKIPGYRERLQRSIALAPFEYIDAERAAPMVRPGLYSEKKRAASKANAKKAQAARRVWDSKEEGVRIRARRYSKRKKILQGLANPRRLMRVKALQRVLEAMQGEDPEILRHPAMAEAVNAATRDSDAEVRMKAEACLEVVSRVAVASPADRAVASPAVTAGLLAALRDDKDEWVRHNSAEALMQRGIA